MELLKDRILRDGIVKSGNVLKVDSFLNHQIDIRLMDEIGREFYRRFQDNRITKIMTIEASGIAVACAVARYFSVPVIFARKAKSSTLDENAYTSRIKSFTHKDTNWAMVSANYLDEEDSVLIIDDFLAEGNATQGLLEICDYAGATVVGVGAVIEKGFQNGGKLLRENGVHVESLAIIESMGPEGIKFRD